MSNIEMTNTEWAVQELMLLVKEQDETASNIKEIYKGVNAEEFVIEFRKQLDELIWDKVSEENLCPTCFDKGDEVELGTAYGNVTSEYWGSVQTTQEPIGSVCQFCGLI